MLFLKEMNIEDAKKEYIAITSIPVSYTHLDVYKRQLAGEKKEEVQESKENEDSNESDINEKNNESLEATFPKENAKRAIVVSLTNAYSSDVFKKDGNTYDLKKFHSYAEVSEFNLKIEKDGEWTAKDDKTWHIDNIELKSATKIYIKASLDVIFNGENYIISNISGLMGAKNISDEVQKIFQMIRKLI